MTINLVRLLVCLALYYTSSEIIKASEDNSKSEVILKPSGSSLMTGVIQKAVDKCSDEGGGLIRFKKGTFFSGTIELRNHITLYLEKGAIITGSSKYSDYKNDAFFFGSDLSDVAIKGEGIIDGVDCYNPNGEEGFRGPHCIRLINCRNITLEGITIKNSANWAINCRHCSVGIVTNVTILGGHDGLHTRFCNNFTVKGCDFRTGDDAFAGNDNKDFDISGCRINTSCHGFRMGCLNLSVYECWFWGPGEYSHKIQKRNNMLSAFVHFSPADEHPELKSGNWTISDVTVDNVDNFYIYNFQNGLWQTGQPVTSVSFENITATGLLKAFYIYGDPRLLFNFSLKNSSFAFREGENKSTVIFEGARLSSDDFFKASSFDQISLGNVTFTKKDSSIILNFESGNKLVIDQVGFNTGADKKPFRFQNVNSVEMNKITLNGIELKETGK